MKLKYGLKIALGASYFVPLTLAFRILAISSKIVRSFWLCMKNLGRNFFKELLLIRWVDDILKIAILNNNEI